MIVICCVIWSGPLVAFHGLEVGDYSGIVGSMELLFDGGSCHNNQSRMYRRLLQLVGHRLPLNWSNYPLQAPVLAQCHIRVALCSMLLSMQICHGHFSVPRHC